MVTVTTVPTARRLHPLRINWTARLWWLAAQAILLAASALMLWVVWAAATILDTSDDTLFWWAMIGATGIWGLDMLSRAVGWQAWAEVPGAHAPHRPWTRPRFEFTRTPEIVATLVRFSAVAAAGFALAGQSTTHAYAVGFVGSLMAFFGASSAAREVLNRKMDGQTINWLAVACEGLALLPGVVWCIAGDTAAIGTGTAFAMAATGFVLVWKVLVWSTRSPSRGAAAVSQ